MKAQHLERKVEKLPRIKKIMEQYFSQGNTTGHMKSMAIQHPPTNGHHDSKSTAH